MIGKLWLRVENFDNSNEKQKRQEHHRNFREQILYRNKQDIYKYETVLATLLLKPDNSLIWLSQRYWEKIAMMDYQNR